MGLKKFSITYNKASIQIEIHFTRKMSQEIPQFEHFIHLSHITRILCISALLNFS